jgi:hypothetical protein
MSLQTAPTQPRVEPAPPPAEPSPRASRFWTPAFTVVAAVLLAAALGLTTATQWMQLYFKKLAVPLAARLDDAERGVPKRLGPWVMVSKDEPLDQDLQHSLGTDQYVFRDYVDSRLVSEAEIALFTDKDTDQRRRMVRILEQQKPEAVVRFALTYYTGLADTVAHIPDRCMVADGYEPKNARPESAELGTYADGSPRKITAQFIHFQDQTGNGREDRNISYFFHVNGQYKSSPREVRIDLQNLFERHGYYAKIELMNAVRDEAQAVALNNDLLLHALPEIERCLPDWKQVKAAAEKKPSAGV